MWHCEAWSHRRVSFFPALLAEFLFEHLVLVPKIRYNLLLLAIDPASKNYEEYLSSLQDKAHGWPDREAKNTHHVARNANSQEPRRLKSEFQACHKLRYGKLLWFG